MPRRYKEARQAKKIKLTDAADILGVSQPALSAWEGERKSPSIDNLIRMAEEYEVSTDYLLKDEVEDIPKGNASQPAQEIEDDSVYLSVDDANRYLALCEKLSGFFAIAISILMSVVIALFFSKKDMFK